MNNISRISIGRTRKDDKHTPINRNLSYPISLWQHNLFEKLLYYVEISFFLLNIKWYKTFLSWPIPSNKYCVSLNIFDSIFLLTSSKSSNCSSLCLTLSATVVCCLITTEKYWTKKILIFCWFLQINFALYEFITFQIPDIPFLAFWLVHSASVISPYTESSHLKKNFPKCC